jgi:predicted transcriptional regulator
MPEARIIDPHLVAQIVQSYVEHNTVQAGALPELIAAVHGSLAALGKLPMLEERPAPAVSLRQSVQRDYVVCLDCGHRGVMLRGHIRVAHGLNRAAYRARWKLSADHPLTAPSYSARRSTVAKQLGLGRFGRGAASAPSPEALPAQAAEAPKRRGRPRRTPSAP